MILRIEEKYIILERNTQSQHLVTNSQKNMYDFEMNSKEFTISFSASPDFLDAMSQGMKNQKIDELVEKTTIENEGNEDHCQFLNEKSETDSSATTADKLAKSDNHGVTD
ncbi:hypothetical protein JTB14_013617 [Gonioctena quinquepunctata]|nr:hypothetical protein JTB14_013617 [Gonioctena quinquepunctata]